ncbi:DEAD/DEAH box helicase [Rodentibacter trehalosifermentans]|uniref:Helicase n=1 Tax=Rodentibacter trehalosifermentans TaxID=1908263 RepID=A0A1V3IR77_9PAST|nr:DEAD/DEAH box helicase [Rodentibacter trehalosifermentans]OOF44419.1 hypothetical protein BKK51_09000 [Rodentibacter trehalosifermentans]OOF45319.1 hypothetical protein BKK52_12685 [Rodentibacter trehalosifermentans]OOF53955.1 hypothetical protein BKK53_00050 [Rodentibacter trehalosifermentans]
MGLLDLIKKSFSSKNKLEQKITYVLNPYHSVEFILPPKAIENPEHFAKSNPFFALQYGYLKTLQSHYDDIEFLSGRFIVDSVILPDLGDDFIDLFEMPPRFSGSYQADIRGNTTKPNFSVNLKLITSDGSLVSHFKLKGAFLALTEKELYSLTSIEYQALKALEQYQNLPDQARTEYENNWLMFQLQTAKKAGLDIDLSHFNQTNLELVKPDSIGVSVHQLPNGDVELIPAIKGVEAENIRERLGQLKRQDSRILRVKNKFVLFDERTISAIDEIFPLDENGENRHIRRINKNEVVNFLKNPTAYLDAAIVDLDTGFSLRVAGAEKFVHKYFGGEQESGINWLGDNHFIHSPLILESLIQSDVELEEAKSLIQNAQNLGSSVIQVDDTQIDISDEQLIDKILIKIAKHIQDKNEEDDESQNGGDAKAEKTETAVVDIEDNDEENRFKRFVSVLNSQEIPPLNQANLKRTPYPHQQEGIDWILSHLRAAENEQTESGALLADDMGLGKTYMTLVSVAEYYRRQIELEKTLKPTLVVAPLSLLENWQAEIGETFKKSPFKDVVVLQGNGMKKYRLGGREIKQHLHNDIATADEIRYSLKIGKAYKSERLDMPERLILTTYQTLRDYQFSLCRIDWGIAIFDEAQNLKNPNTLATRAAKGLKAEFKLLATGTPIENSLKDFWCLMDTATPGLLGSWREFREQYVAPIQEADEAEVDTVKYQIGRELRETVDRFMLRRTKAEKLEGLPEKIIYSGYRMDEHYLPQLEAQMSGIQLQCYNDVISETRSATNKQGAMLAGLRNLKMISIHPHIKEIKSKEGLNCNLSNKILSLLNILNEIEKKQEKVLIFAESKSVQSHLVALIMMTYGINVDVINGETAAVATSKNSRSRKNIIDEFQAKSGFGILIMSPVAAGVGLTVTGANNVIHLERHWNPAKEAQATDRVYRIGQKKQVNVYLPMATHPEIHSFDIQLHKLLNNKVDLSEAVVANPDIEPEQFMSIFKK